MALSGIYIVTLNNPHPISVNANDKRVADRAIKVTKDNCKVGKAKDLEKRKNNYFKTFGEPNVNFRALAHTEEIDSIEKVILKGLNEYRMRGISGRKNEWLENISSDETIKMVRKLLEENGIKTSD
jgi:hypothetical protein